MTIAPSVRQLGLLVATASLVLGACSPSSDGGSGKVVEQPIETISTDFDFTDTGTFTVGDAPANAAFSGGIAVDGATSAGCLEDVNAGSPSGICDQASTNAGAGSVDALMTQLHATLTPKAIGRSSGEDQVKIFTA